MLSLNSKHVQHVKIYLHVACNFKVNLITHLEVIALFSSFIRSQVLPSPGVRRPSVSFFHILIFSSETTWSNGTKLGSKHLCKVLDKVSPFCSVPPTNMAAKGNSCFWLATVQKNILLWNCLFVLTISGSLVTPL
jgi:hypothetical protein